MDGFFKMIKHRKINNKAMCICGSKMIHVRSKGWQCPEKADDGVTNFLMNYPLIVTNENSDKIEVTNDFDFKMKLYRVNVKLKK